MEPSDFKHLSNADDIPPAGLGRRSLRGLETGIYPMAALPGTLIIGASIEAERSLPLWFGGSSTGGGDGGGGDGDAGNAPGSDDSDDGDDGDGDGDGADGK